MTHEWKCAGCGAPYPDRVGDCDCVTTCLYRMADNGLIHEIKVAPKPPEQSALETAIGHIEHMAAWITKQNAGYSFESLSEDMPGIRAALTNGKRDTQ